MNIVTEIQERFNEVESARNEMKGRIGLLREQKSEADKQLDEFATQYECMGRVVKVLQKYSKAKEQVLREKLDNIVTRGLQLIFGPKYRSKLVFGIKRGQAVIQARIITEIDGKEFEADIAEAHGGGLVDVCGIIFQILVLSLVKPRQKRILFLDEVFKHLSEKHLEAAGEFIKELSEKLELQVVMISHKKQMTEIADKVYEFKLQNGITEATLVGE